MNHADIVAELFRLQDKEYGTFQSKLIPSVSAERVIGVRTPELRSLARRLAGEAEVSRFLEDLPHRGFACFNSLIEQYRPAYMLYGHIHASYGMSAARETLHPSGTRLINGSGYYRFQIGDGEYPREGKTGSALYDLYLALKKRN